MKESFRPIHQGTANALPLLVDQVYSPPPLPPPSRVISRSNTTFVPLTRKPNLPKHSIDLNIDIKWTRVLMLPTSGDCNKMQSKVSRCIWYIIILYTFICFYSKGKVCKVGILIRTFMHEHKTGKVTVISLGKFNDQLAMLIYQKLAFAVHLFFYSYSKTPYLPLRWAKIHTQRLRVHRMLQMQLNKLSQHTECFTLLKCWREKHT
ncbi:hypothetical protein EGR_10666 [Echinococcus granulosus]|uniref:Uncharacterized protein n=1 Tax=Echinococcus granulosus TaxID=6210 RepID=W6U7W4_ECHGR|nr:hypothetical protein EGR_10666 [Echinococcus granulosus]EUB54467.1 hypothetical protein EGR_10666 [Echinococcus granulosus]